MSLSGMLEIYCLQTRRKFVMPVKTGIQVRLWITFKNRLYSGFRRNDYKSRLPVEFRTFRLLANGRSVFSIALILLALFACPLALHAQAKKPSTLSELVAYTGADREQILISGAKAEGKVVWYTSLAGSSYKELAQGFEKKYPGVKVDVYRAASNELMARITAEAKARQYIVDTIETTLPLLKSLREDGLLAVYTSPHLLKYPAHAKEAAGNGLYYWGVNRESFIGVGYNPKLIASSVVPKNFNGLLHPQLKGKMGLTTSDTGVRMMGAILKFKGDEFARKLKAQEISLHSVSGRAMADMAISGEVPISPSIFRDHAMESKGKGAPIDWVPMEAVPTNAGATSIVYQAPHPHGAVLMADFILSPEGQKILENLEFGNPSKDFGFKRWYPEAGMTTEKYDKEATAWQKALRELGRK
jgi:iron(III) transport system substrate-binding protein